MKKVILPLIAMVIGMFSLQHQVQAADLACTKTADNDLANSNSVPSEVSGDANCTQVFTSNNETISILTGTGNINNITLTGYWDVGPPADLDGAYSGIYAAKDAGLTGLNIEINAGVGKGIIQNLYAARHQAAVFIEGGNSISTLNVTSGTISSVDTAVFLTESDSSGTDITVAAGASIEGARVAIRHDVDTAIAQIIGNDGVSSVSDGQLILRVQNYGTIKSDPTTVTLTGQGDEYAFYIGGDNRIKKDISIQNHEDALIEGRVIFGTKKQSTYSSESGTDHITSDVYFMNEGSIISSHLKSDYNTAMEFINAATGSIIIKDGIMVAGVTNQAFGIQLQGFNESVFTNYGDVDGKINASSRKSTINLNGGEFNGNIIFAGTLNLADTLGANTISSDIASSYDQEVFRVSSDVDKDYETILNIGGATNNVIAGENTAEIEDGDNHTGKLTMEFAAGGTGTQTISTNLNDSGSFGRLNLEGAATIGSGVSLNINLTEGYSYLEHDTTYVIIDGEYQKAVDTATDSLIVNIDDANISVNNISDYDGVLRFSTEVEDENSNLILRVTRLTADELTDDELAHDVYSSLEEEGSTATGSLKDFQQYIDNIGSRAEVETALKTIGPNNSGDIEFATLAPIMSILRSTTSRIDSFSNRYNLAGKDHAKLKTRRIGAGIDKYRMCYDNDFIDQHLFGVEGGSPDCYPSNQEEYFSGYEDKEYSIWGQAFGTHAKQEHSASNGFRNRMNGLTVGIDKEMEKNYLVGGALSYARSDIYSLDNLRDIDMESYQMDLYAAKTYDKFFWNAIVGFTYNHYNSQRSIPSLTGFAGSSYYGRNFFGQLRAGKNFKKVKDSNFDVIPEITATYVHTRIGSYNETGADTLNLNVKSSVDNYLEGRVGVNVNYNDMLYHVYKYDPILGGYGDKASITYKSHVSYGYDFLNRRQKVQASLSSQGNLLHSTSHKVDSGSFRIGTGIDVSNVKSLTVSLDYFMDIRSSYLSHSGFAKIRYKF